MFKKLFRFFSPIHSVDVKHPDPKLHPIGTTLLVGTNAVFCGEVLNWSDSGEYLEFAIKGNWISRYKLNILDTVFMVDPLALDRFVRSVIESYERYANKNYPDSYVKDIIDELELTPDDIDSEPKKNETTSSIKKSIEYLSIKWLTANWTEKFKSLKGSRPVGSIQQCGTLREVNVVHDGKIIMNDYINEVVNAVPAIINSEANPSVSDTGPMMPVEYPPKDGVKADITPLTPSSNMTTIDQQAVSGPIIVNPFTSLE